MDQAGFQHWPSASDRLTAAQRAGAARAVSTDADEERSVAAVERSVGESRVCPRCGEGGAVRKGRTRGLWRYLCKSCGRTFNALTSPPLQGLHKKERWLSFGESLAEGETAGTSARRCEGSWRRTRPISFKAGKAKTRGLSKDFAPVLFAADRSGATLGAALDSTQAEEVEDVLRQALAGADATRPARGRSDCPTSL